MADPETRRSCDLTKGKSLGALARSEHPTQNALRKFKARGGPRANGRSWADHAATRGERLLQSASEQLQRRGQRGLGFWRSSRGATLGGEGRGGVERMEKKTTIPSGPRGTARSPGAAGSCGSTGVQPRLCTPQIVSGPSRTLTGNRRTRRLRVPGSS